MNLATEQGRIPLHERVRQQGVLVVEDSLVQRKIAVSMLRQAGVSKIYEAEDGKSALVLLRSLFQPPAVVLLDLEMPGMDGIEFVQQMANEGLRPSVLVASSAASSILSSVEVMLEGLGLPILGTVTKPLSYAVLADALRRFRHQGPGAVDRPGGQECMPGRAEIEAALREDRILPYYQPKVCLGSGEVSGFEALARLVLPDGSVLLPGSFIEQAENCGVMDELTLAMLDAMLLHLTAWHDAGFYPKLALNVSAQSLSGKQFANEVMRRVDAARISPSSLVIEITESALVSDLVTALGTLGRLRLKGFGLSIDDYGTGFSSMQQLSRLPFSELKIDRAFVRHAHEKWNLRAILQSAIEMGHRLGLTTVAEGIETPEELQLLQALGCQYAQGYLLAHPMPAQAVQPWVEQSRSRLAALVKTGEAS